MNCYAFILFLTFFNSIQIYAACPLGYAESNDPTKCYRLVAGPVNFFDAESNCARSAKNGHLLSISNSFVNSFIAESTRSTMLDSSLQVFIGGYLNGSSWTWSDGSPFVYKRWAKGQPNGNGSCIGLNPGDGYWYSLSCDMLIPFYICEAVISSEVSSTPPPVILACDPEWTYFNKSCYKVFHNANWTSAQDFCVKNGSNLTSIHSLEENQFLIALTKMGHDLGTTNIYTLNVWIGLNDFAQAGIYTWADGTPYDYQKWGPGAPLNDQGDRCILLVPDEWSYANQWFENWVDSLCYAELRAFVCKKPSSIQ